MDRYKFRGKPMLEDESQLEEIAHLIKDGWVYGSLVGKDLICGEVLHVDDQYFNTEWWCSVDESTVGQYTGLKDKNGKEIYEGDILRYPPKNEWKKNNFVAFEVFFHDNNYADKHVGYQMNRIHFFGSIGGYSTKETFLPKYTEKMIVISNIHDNLELLKGE